MHHQATADGDVTVTFPAEDATVIAGAVLDLWPWIEMELRDVEDRPPSDDPIAQISAVESRERHARLGRVRDQVMTLIGDCDAVGAMSVVGHRDAIRHALLDGMDLAANRLGEAAQSRDPDGEGLWRSLNDIRALGHVLEQTYDDEVAA